MIDAILHYTRYTLYYLPEFLVNVDFINYYTYMALFSFIIWYQTEKKQHLEEEKNLILMIISFGLYLTMAMMYIISQEQFFFELSLIIFSFHGVFASFFICLNTLHLHSSSNYSKWLGLLIGGIIWLFGHLLYPAFLFSQFVFFIALTIYYIGFVFTLLSLVVVAMHPPNPRNQSVIV
jgi:hypothetical protein